MKTVDYLLSALKHHGGRADGFLTDTPIGIKLAEDDIVRVRYDAQTMRWIALFVPCARQYSISSSVDEHNAQSTDHQGLSIKQQKN